MATTWLDSITPVGGGPNSPYVQQMARRRLLGPGTTSNATQGPVGGLQPFQTRQPLGSGAASDSLGQARPPVGPVTPPPSQWQQQNAPGQTVPGDVNFGAGFGGTLNDILRNFLGAGIFGPTPSQQVLGAVRSQALQDAQARRERASLQAQSMGLDPASAASLGLRSDLGASGDVANSVNMAALQELLRQQGFGQNALLALLGRQAQQNGPTPGFDIGSVLGLIGQLGAAGIGKIH